MTNELYRGDYTVELLVGSERARCNVIVDTGSSTLSVRIKKYRPARDKSRHDTTLVQEIIYGTGGWAGPVVTTELEFAGAKSIIANIAIAVDQELDNFAPADGILGLAYNFINDAYDMRRYLAEHGLAASYPWPLQRHDTRQAIIGIERRFGNDAKTVVPAFTAFVNEHVFANKFAFYGGRSTPNARRGSPQNKGFLVLGGGEEHTEFYRGKFHAIRVVNDIYYNVHLKAVRVGNQPLRRVAGLTRAQISGNYSNAIVDSGNTTISLTPAIYQTLVNDFGAIDPRLKAVLKQKSWRNSVLSRYPWPDIAFTFEGVSGTTTTLTCKPSTYWQVDSGRVGYATFQFDKNNQQSIFGLPLFANYYVVFDRSLDIHGTIKFAERA